MQQPRGVPPALRVGLGAEVDQVPGVVVAVAEDGGLGVVEQRQDLLEEARFALGREPEVELPDAAPEDRPPSVEVLAGRDPGVEASWSAWAGRGRGRGGAGTLWEEPTYQSATLSHSGPTAVTRPLMQWEATV